jgi:hypothetical protein
MDTIRNRSSFLQSRRWLQFAASAAPLAWGVHGLGSLLVVTRSCHGGHGRAAGLFVRVFTIALLAALAALGAACYASWHQLARRGAVLRSEGRDQSEMLALVGLLASIAFAVGISWDGLPAFLVSDLCEALR